LVAPAASKPDADATAEDVEVASLRLAVVMDEVGVVDEDEIKVRV
jgi:hypothetical protein